MRIGSCVVALLAALAVGAPGQAIAQAPELPDDTPGVSQQFPAPLDGDGGREPASGEREGARPAADDELPNTGLELMVTLVAGAMLTLFGVALRLRAADAKPH